MARSLAALVLLVILASPVTAWGQRCSDEGANEHCEWTRPGRALPTAVADKSAHSLASQKIASLLRDAVAQTYAPDAKSLRSLEVLSTEAVRVNSAGDIQVYVILTEFLPDYVAQLEAMGLRVELTLPAFRLIQGWVPADAIELIAGFDFVVEVKPPGYAVLKAGDQVSAGDGILRADSARALFGVTGAGVKVGVMSNGVDHLAQSVATGDLPAGVQVLQNAGGDEGTAMLEIVHDLAPGAALAFYGPLTSAEMVNGINSLAAAGARVVVDDLIFFDESKFQDGMIAQTARNFATGGKVYVTAAGNQARKHYRAPYNRLAGQNYPSSLYPALHNYVPSPRSDIGNTFRLPNGCTVQVVLQWNNPNGTSADDFDLVLGRSGTIAVLASSKNFQTGTQNAYEFLSYTNNSGSPITAFIAVAEWKLTSPASSIVLDYFIYEACGISSGAGFEYVTSADSVLGHAAVEELLSVAALGASAPTSAESFSSRGPGSISFPTPQSRAVPNISGIDCVATAVGINGFFVPGNPTFCGTSAAAPHVAAVAALMIERNPALTSQQLRDLITTHAVDLGTPGFDFASGFGRVDALASVSAASDRPAVTIGPATCLAPEAGPACTMTVNRTGPTSSSLTVFYSLGGTATNGLDYQTLPGSVTIPAGAASATISVDPIIDDTKESDENVVVQLEANSAYVVGSSNSSTVFIIDKVSDDNFPLNGQAPVGWTTSPGASGGWLVASDSTFVGPYSLKSAAVGDNQTAAIQVSGMFKAGNISFASRVSSESDHEFLYFYIDDIPMSQASGNLSWSQTSFNGIVAGAHTFKWAYVKNGGGAVGADAAWIDSVVLPPIASSTTYTVTVSNNGPNEVTGAVVTNPAPAGLAIEAWTCAVTNPGSGGVVTTACGDASGNGPLNTTANLKVGGRVTYTIAATVTAAGGSVTNTATVRPPQGTINAGTSCTTIAGSNSRSFDAATGTCSATDTDPVIP